MLIRTKVRIPDMFLGMLLTIAIFAMGLIIGSSGNQPSQQIPNAASGNANQPENYWGAGWHWLTHDAGGFFTLFLVIVGIGQIVVFLRQLYLIRESLTPAKDAAIAAKDLASAQRDEFRATHRPKLHIRHFRLRSPHIAYDEPIRAQVTYVNQGIQDAILEECGYTFWLIRKGSSLPVDYDVPSTPVVGRLSSGVALPMPDMVHSISQIDEIGLRDGRADLYCHGFVRYRDDARRLRTTAFCRKLKITDRVGLMRGRFVKADEPEYEFDD